MKGFFIIFLSLVLINCQSQEKPKQNKKEKKDTTKTSNLLDNDNLETKLPEKLPAIRISVNIENTQFDVMPSDDQNWVFPVDKSAFLPFCDTIQYTHYPVYERMKYIEKYSINKDKDFVKRDSLDLILKLKNGTSKTLKDVNSMGESSCHYLYREYLADIGFYVCFVSFYEGASYLLINDATGDVFLVNGIPQISPDKKRIATSSYDAGSYFNDYKLNIWAIKNKKIKKQYSVDVNGLIWNCDWSDANVLKFQLMSSPMGIRIMQKDERTISSTDFYTVYDLKITE